jgi:AcrR family transcriptional regulator
MQEHCSHSSARPPLTCDDGRVSENRPSRAEARAHQIETIKSTSRRLMAERGAPGLSLREVTREMGLVSSAIYRYFPTRDDLLTALIVDAYNDLGASAERAVLRCSKHDAASRLRAAASSMRKWAKSNPNEYALIYGSPVPGYEAATRATMVLANIITDAWRESSVALRPPDPRASFGAMLELSRMEEAMPGVPNVIRARGLMVWTLIFGFVSFELFGSYRGSVRNANKYFDFVLDELVETVLPRRVD